MPAESVSAYSTTPTKNGSTVTISKPNPKPVSTERFREEGYTLMQSVSHLQPVPSKSDPTLPSPESPMDVSKKRLSRFNSDQMGHLIDMLRRTISTQPQNGNDPIPKQAAVPAVIIPLLRLPKPTQSDPTIPKASGSFLSKSRERPSQLSLSTSENEGVSLHGSQEHSVYVNSISLAGEEENGKGSEREREREREEASVPTLVVEQTDEESAPSVQRRKSVGLLNTAETVNAIKFKLGEATIL